MDTSYLVGFSIVAGAIVLLSILSSLFCWVRLNRLWDFSVRLNNELAEKTPPKQIEKALATAEGARARIDTALLELGKFREGVHGEMQRFYAIMKRNEKAAGFVPGQLPPQGKEAEIPDEISASDLKPVTPAQEDKISKADLRKRAREAGL